MIDIHSHILPGIDDGAEDMYDTLEMLKMAVDSGVTAMVATPHCNIPGMYQNYFGEKYIETFRMTEKLIEEEGLPLTLYAGMEVYVTEKLPEYLRDGKILTINGGRYLLVEFSFNEDPDFVDAMLLRLKSLGVRPIVAHPERYEFIQDVPERIADLRQKGILMQVNKGSLQGRFGRKSYHLAHEMLRKHQITVISSDAHSPYQRTPYLKDVYEELLHDYSEKYLNVLFRDNPIRICKDQPTIRIAVKQQAGK